MKTVAWFSGGVSSAIAIGLVAGTIDQIFYIHIDDQHPDTLRFVHDCERWFNQPITILQSPYKTVNNALLGAGGKGYVNGPHGAACTRLLKKRVRIEWELSQDDRLNYIWGFDCHETDRANRIITTMPYQTHLFPLIQQHISKEESHQILHANKIKRPVMYELGYHNNNCIGCVKGGMGYWNKIRHDFPEVFNSRAKVERQVGATCIKGIYLDELNINRGRKSYPLCEDCGIFCETMILGANYEQSEFF